jgi:kumamolisin
MFVRLFFVTAGAALALEFCGTPAYAVTGTAVTEAARDLGPASASVRVDVALVLKYHHRTELDRLVEAQAAPGNALFHHFLTPSQFEAYFAPTSAEYERVASTLIRAGFTVTHEFGNRTVLDASASAPVAARFFKTDIHRVITQDGETAYSNVRPPVVPAGIASLVAVVAGLDAAGRFHPVSSLTSKRTALPPGPQLASNGPPLYGPNGGYGPQIYIGAYDLPAANGFTGTGRTTGVAGDADYLDSDLDTYLSYFEVARTGPPTVRVPVDGGPRQGLTHDSNETTLDVETIVGLAPGTALYLYLAPYSMTNANFIDIDNTVVNDNIVDTLNTSYVYCESRLNKKIPGYAEAVDAIVEQGSAQGITFHSASGDNGSSQFGCPGRVSISTPTDLPHNVSIGGTALEVERASGRETSEVGWDDGFGAGGGGVSVIFPVPSYQENVPNIIPGGRNVPDLAFSASELEGAAFYFDNYFAGSEGGTSLASPIFGAALTEINQLQGSRSGYFNVTLYDLWLTHGYGTGSTASFRDITLGSIPPYGAGPGYDQMTGIGSLQAKNFAALVCAPAHRAC